MDLRAFAFVAIFGVLAVVLGGVLTKLVFHAVDTQGVGDDVPGEGVEGAGSVLRGGVWIGALERLAIYAGLVSSWPEAIAIVLAVKGLGRYPELRSGERSSIAERFIIGTFTSVLWTCGCAGVAVWLR